MSTKIMPVTDLRRDTKAIIHSIREGGDVVYITQHGRPAVVMLDYEEYEALLEKKSKKSKGWPEGFLEKTFGILADNPIERHDPGEFEVRESYE